MIGSGADLAHDQVLANITEALTLVQFLQSKVEGPATAEEAARVAEERLLQFREAVKAHAEEEKQTGGQELIGKLSAEEQFHRQSVIASAPD